MDEDPDRALGAAEDRRRSRPSTSRRRSAGRPPGAGRRAAGRRPARPRRPRRGRAASRLDVDRRRRRRRPRRAAPRAGGAGARRRSATTLRAIWNSQTRNVEAPSPSAGRARSSNRGEVRRARPGTSARWRPPPRGGRRARRTRSCTPGPGTSDTGRRTGPGRACAASTSGRSRSRWARRGPPASSGRSTFLNAGRAIALHPRRDRSGRAGRGGSRRRGPARRPSVAVGSVDEQRAGRRVDAERADRSLAPSGRLELGPSGRSSTWRSAQPARVEPPAAERRRRAARGARGTRRAGRRGRSAGRRRTRAATSSSRRGPAGSRRRPSRR